MSPSAVSEAECEKDLKLTINEKTYSLGPDVPASTSLLRFIRDFAFLPGTKALCYEGGCGICTVVALAPDPEKTGHRMFSLPACQTLVYSCVGWSIRTIEHLGNRFDGYDKVQTALHGFYGTQCGYCTPGFVMTMHGQLETNPDLKMDQIEKSMDGNICRCTGYRPILDAFKSLGTDAPQDLKCMLKDIEEAYGSKCPKTGDACSGKCKSEERCEEKVISPTKCLTIERNGVVWHRPVSVLEIYDLISTTKSCDRVRIVVGNTGPGVYKNEGPFNTFINTTGVEELFQVKFEPEVNIGANVNLTRCIQIFHLLANNKGEFGHLKEIGGHWENVANVGVRNIGSWGGNMMMKHTHPEFTSDIFISLVAIDAKINIGHSNGQVVQLTAEEFLKRDMSKSIILSMVIPPQEDVLLITYKITPRAVNAHAYVNAAFKLIIDKKDKTKVINVPTIVFGGINASFVRATNTEKFLFGKHLSNLSDVKKAVQILGGELHPESNYTDASPKYRKSLAQSLLYKTILQIVDTAHIPTMKSGGPKMVRPLSSSKQKFEKNEDTWPVGKAIPKLESRPQISGEAEFLDDIHPLPNELFGAFVQSTIAVGEIESIDGAQCLKLAGVVDIIKAEDIPGSNTFFISSAPPDPVFADKKIIFAGQPIALVVAKTRAIASAGAKLVRVSYINIKKTPVVTIKDSIKAGRAEKALNFLTMKADPFVVGNAEEGLKTSKHVLSGEVEFGSQFHFTMEPLSARVVPIEDGYDVFGSCQWPTLTQMVVAKNLKISSNCINMSTRRIGGGYGGKISRCNLVCSAAAIAAHKLRTPVRVVLDLSTHMTIVGWRDNYLSNYKVGFNDDGILNAISIDVYSDVGHVPNESSGSSAPNYIPNTYVCPNWRIQPYSAFTDAAANTWCRAPGHPESIATMENIIERVAAFLQVDPLAIREKNFFDADNPQNYGPRRDVNLVKSEVLPLLKKEAEMAKRKGEIEQFNKENRWRKRGMSTIPLRYMFDMVPVFQYNLMVAIYEDDGTVAITHGGIEMGQGINTKVAQVAAKALKIPLDLIQIKPTNQFTGANSFVTGGSYGSDINAHGIRVCCEKLRKRMDDVLTLMETDNGPPSWISLVKECFKKQVDLCERYFTFAKEHPKGYDIWAAACVEVEVDVLTGQFLILRADIIEDCGRSLSPYVDIGQVEGAFVMGIGLMTLEKCKFNLETGQQLANSTWEYKPPSALDIPVDFRVTFLPNKDNGDWGVHRSKATGEPAICMSYAVVSALREAIKSARKDAGNTDWFEIDTPLTVEKIHDLCLVDANQFEV